MQFEQVVGSADHRPFVSDLIEASQQKLAKSSGLLDLAEDRRNHLLAQSIATTQTGAAQFERHGGDAGAFLVVLVAGMSGAAGGDISADAAALEVQQICFATITCVGRDFLGVGAAGPTQLAH